ncbi:Rtr1/RPAP2 family-domain-containing protein [Xylaria sp. CBS 124048]|nr:Rtr1/RPAP2 family-domain-containing protein [Xylaria sp. CBS 124048]
MPAQANSPPKSILKNKGAPPSSNAEKATSNPREIAIKHARIIHSRREVEDQIADSMIELSKFPPTRDASHNASNPADADAESFKNLVRLYQPSDYDDLIEERNANGLCGYTLCPNPHSRVSSGGTFKLVNYGRKDFDIVPSRELEKWCSHKCAKRAMYVKVQLNETAAWERAGISSIQIDLFGENQGSAGDTPERLKTEVQEKAAQNARDLALERGDVAQNGKMPKRSMKLVIREKPVKPPTAPSNPDGQGHLVTEGYKTTFHPGAATLDREKSQVERETSNVEEEKNHVKGEEVALKL